ncbi:MAG: hypothetical protein ACR2K6_08495 [Solirubrobacterales bacterium]
MIGGLLPSPPPPSVASEDFFGVSGVLSDEADFELMEDSRVGVYRVLFHFRAAKRQREGFYDWRRLDRLVTSTATREIELLPLLYGTPDWISTDESIPPIYNEEASKQWQRLLEELVSRYGPNGLFWRLNPLLEPRPIRTWQIWNEPNDPAFWGPRPDAAAYAHLIDISARAIRSIDPEARLIGAGITANPGASSGVAGDAYLRDLLSHSEAVAQLNAIGFHPYARSMRGVRAALRSARGELVRAGLPLKPIWVTEVGWGSGGGRRGGDLVKNDPGQARALKLTLRMISRRRLSLGVQRALWYYWRDQPDPRCRWCRTAGLIDSDRRPKASYDAFVDLARP